MDDNTRPASALPATARSLPMALIRARETVMEPIRRMLSKSGITEQQWRILRVLDEYGPLDATTLADRSGLLLPSQTRIVQSMSERGLITRATDSRDRRRQTLTITAAGRAILAANADEARDIARAIEARIGPEKLEQLLDLLDDLQK